MVEKHSKITRRRNEKVKEVMDSYLAVMERIVKEELQCVSVEDRLVAIKSLLTIHTNIHYDDASRVIDVIIDTCSNGDTPVVLSTRELNKLLNNQRGITNTGDNK